MRLGEIGEFELIERISSILTRRCGGVMVGLGDDAAVVELGEVALILTADSLVEGVHFRLETHTPRQIGYKSLAVNLSDVAAMGGEPRYALISISLPERLTVEFVEEMYEGAEEIASRSGVTILGGDTTGSESSLFISVALLGECPKGEVITRSGAREGDLIGITGTVGDSAAGLNLLSGLRVEGLAEEDAEYLRTRHLLPQPRLEAARRLASLGVISSMIDVSDGVSSEVWHICRMSGVGAEVWGDELPLSDQLIRFARLWGGSPLDLALNGGEDYELLFTFPPEALSEVEGELSRLGVRFTVVGRITPPDEGVRLIRRGEATPLKPGGFRHW